MTNRNDISELSIGRFLQQASEYVALIGGVLLLVVMVFVTANVISGAAFNNPILGDTEVVELLGAIAIFAFLPYCHIEGANVVIEVIEKYVSPIVTAVLDIIAGVLFFVVSILVYWRLVVGGLEVFTNDDVTMFLQIPVSVGYMGAFVPGLLWVIVSFYLILVQFQRIACTKDVKRNTHQTDIGL